MALALSILALVLTFYQAYLQRLHNEKSVKPLMQINLTDHNGLLYVHIRNNGLGPMIIDRLTFTKDGQIYNDIRNCLTISPRLYQYVPISEAVKKVVQPDTYLEVFSKQFEVNSDTDINDVRSELAALKLKVEGQDIYDNKIVVERNLNWFGKYSVSKTYNL